MDVNDIGADRMRKNERPALVRCDHSRFGECTTGILIKGVQIGRSQGAASICTGGPVTP